MWNSSKGVALTMRPYQEPLGRRLYVGAKTLVRTSIKAGLLLVAPALGAVFLKLAWAVVSLIFIYVLSWWTPESLKLGSFWDMGARSISWVLSERPGLGWLVAGAAITWWPLIRSR